MRAVMVLAGLLLATGAAQAANNFLPVDEAFRLSVQRTNAGNVELTWQIAPDYYLYQDRLSIEVLPKGAEAEINKPIGQAYHDRFYGDIRIYRGSVRVTVDPKSAGALRVHWQGCADAGLCYPPQSRRIELSQLAAASTGAGQGQALARDKALASTLEQAALAWTLLIFFGMGLLLTFTPCVLPMIPILSSLVVGAGGGMRRSAVLSLAFIFPMAMTYAILGTIAGLAGSSLTAFLQNPWVLGAFSGVFVLLALSLFGVYELQMPAAIRNRLDMASRNRKGGTLGGAAGMGVLSALLVSPCMTAPLAGALLYIAQTGNAWIGGSALLSLGLGMGVPLLLVGVFGASLLPRPGPWMNAVKAFFGFVMLGMGIYLLQRVLSGPVTLALWGLLGLAIAVTIVVTGWRRRDNAAILSLTSASGVVVGIAGLAMLTVAAMGGSSLWALSPSVQPAASSDSFMGQFEPVPDNAALNRKLAAAAKADRWTLVDFYADWCVACKVIEEEVFGDPRVQAKLSDFQLLRPDITEYNASDQALMEHFNIMGPPTILLIGPNGKERRALRVIGEISADAFLKRLRKLQGTE